MDANQCIYDRGSGNVWYWVTVLPDEPVDIELSGSLCPLSRPTDILIRRACYPVKPHCEEEEKDIMEHVYAPSTTEELLAQCALLLNDFGPGSPEAEAFIDSHIDDQEFVTLARLSSDLKRALMVNHPDLNKIHGLSSSLARSLESDSQEDQGTRLRDNPHLDGHTPRSYAVQT